MQIFLKYLLKSLFFSSLLFSLFFIFLFALIYGTINLKDFLNFKPSLTSIGKYYCLVSLQLLSFVLPLSAFLSTLFVLQKKKEEGEFLAFFSLGFTLRDFFKVYLIFLFFIFILIFFSHLYLTPKGKRLQKLEEIKIFSQLSEREILPKTPYLLTDTLSLYVNSAKKENSTYFLQGVTLLEKKSNLKRGIYLAKEGLLDFKEGRFVLERGVIFILAQEKEKKIEIIRFEKYDFQIPLANLKKEDLYIKRGEMSLLELKREIAKIQPSTLKYHRYITEYYNRFLYGFSVIPLLIQGFLLGIFLKSMKKITITFVALIFYIFYYFFYNFFVSLSENGKLNILYGQIIFNFIFYLFLYIQYKYLKTKGISYL